MCNDRELVLVSARKSRGSNHWDKDDYDVRRGDVEGPVVGRIFRSAVAPTTAPWFWTIIKLKPLKPTERGYAITRADRQPNDDELSSQAHHRPAAAQV